VLLFLQKSNNSGFTKVQFHENSSSPTLFAIFTSLQQSTMAITAENMKKFVISKNEVLEVSNSITTETNRYFKTKSRRKDPCGIPDRNEKNCYYKLQEKFANCLRSYAICSQSHRKAKTSQAYGQEEHKN
jgi:hypothetical protein